MASAAAAIWTPHRRLVANDAEGGGKELKGRTGLPERLGLSADDDQEVAFPGALRATGQRGVNKGHTVFGKLGHRCRNGLGAHGAAEDHDGARLQDGSHAVLTEQDVVQLLAVADRQEQGVRAFGGFAGSAEGLDACRGGEIQAGFGDVEAVDGQLGCKAGCHRQAHGAQAEDGNGVVAGHDVLR
jgi:hypothetical protein